MEHSEKGRLISWRGNLDKELDVARVAGIALLAILSCTMVATQTNYFVVGNAHLIAVLAPITACAFLYGPLPAALVGLLAGASEMAHAILLPLDAYEAYFAAPSNSVVLFALMGLVMGLLFGAEARHGYKSEASAAATLVLTCLAGSALFTFLFSVSVNVINSLVSFEIPSEIISDFTGNAEVTMQIVLDFLLMAFMAIASAQANRVFGERKKNESLRETFQGWLAVIMASAYLITSALSYTVVSSVCRGSAERQMQGQIDYLASQLDEHDKLVTGMAAQESLSGEDLEALHAQSVAGVATKLPLSEGGIVSVADNGTIVSSNNQAYVGQSFEEVVGSGLAGGFDPSLYQQTRSTQWYMGNTGLGYLRAAEVGYVRIQTKGAYQLMAAMPSTDVFKWRPWAMVAISGVFAALFAAIYTQASLLLRDVVIKRIDQTNETLALITSGDLEQKVNVTNPIEFARLSLGINETVGSLKRAIDAEASRIDRDLATAKAIQESALPSAFPPFPDIDAFDIYAHMQAAREVGGDFYDMFLVNESTLCFLIADVSGKGIPAALFMMAAKTEIANNVNAGMELPIALQTANWHLCQSNDAEMFVTVWAGLLDWNTGELTYVNAGHNPPLLRHNGTWRWLTERGGLFLGSYETMRYKPTTIRLSQGDELFLYTDGVNEAFSASGEQYGDQRLEAFLMEHADLHPHALINALREDLARWAAHAEQSDDITMLSLEYGVPPEAAGSLTVDAELDRLEDVLELIRTELAQRHCPITVQNQIDIALEELFVNVCNYAYKELGGHGSCRIDYVYNANPHTITISLTDWGVPFDPLEHKDPTKPSSLAETKIGGLGILMVKRMTDEVAYMRDGDANVVVFKKSW